MERDGTMPDDSIPAVESAGIPGGSSRSTEGEISRRTKGAWDRLRLENPVKPAIPAQAPRENGVGSKEDQAKEEERRKEQREFDEMLEWERQGAGESEKWR